MIFNHVYQIGKKKNINLNLILLNFDAGFLQRMQRSFAMHAKSR